MKEISISRHAMNRYAERVLETDWVDYDYLERAIRHELRHLPSVPLKGLYPLESGGFRAAIMDGKVLTIRKEYARTAGTKQDN